MLTEENLLDPIENSPQGIPFSHSEDQNNRDLGGALELYKVFESAYSTDSNFRTFVDNLSGDEKVLDLGFGLGSGIIRFLEKRNKLKRLFSVDLDFKNLEAKTRPGITEKGLMQADAAFLPFPSGSMDIIVVYLLMTENKLNLTTKKELISAEITRVLKIGGYLIWYELGMEPSLRDFELLFKSLFINFYKRRAI